MEIIIVSWFWQNEIWNADFGIVGSILKLKTISSGFVDKDSLLFWMNLLKAVIKFVFNESH